jgi:sulfite exporter TauE/SafE
MFSLVVAAFITGLTAGGLSCFAVQGGLLSGSIAQQVEADTRARGQAAPVRSKRKPAPVPASRAQMIQPILLFMVAKLAAYTILGFFLGMLGSAFTFSPGIKGFIQIAIGIFLVGNALRMFNVHPIFRYFSFEPPSSVTRYIRRLSKRGDRAITPLFLGALTVLIPCGVTQSVMAIAIGTANPALGAVIMFAFVLGTSPTFVGISWLATNLGGMFQKYFYQVVAVIVLLLGLYTLDGGLALAGSPFSVSGMLRANRVRAEIPATAPAGLPAAAPLTGASPADSGSSTAGEPVLAQPTTFNITVFNDGYAPELLPLPANREIKLRLITDNIHSCSRAFYIPALNIMEVLPETGETIVTIPPQAPDTNMQFMCSMGMYGGFIEFQ